MRRALAALFGGTVGKDTVSRTWRKVKERLGYLEHPPAGRGSDRALDPRRHRRFACGSTAEATSISLLVVLGVRADGQKVLLAIKSMGGESAEGMAHCPRRSHQARAAGGRSFSLSMARRGSTRPLPPSGTECRCNAARVHKHRNLFAHAPERLHDEITSDYNDMIYATTPEDIAARRKAFIRKW